MNEVFCHGLCAMDRMTSVANETWLKANRVKWDPKEEPFQMMMVSERYSGLTIHTTVFTTLHPVVQAHRTMFKQLIDSSKNVLRVQTIY